MIKVYTLIFLIPILFFSSCESFVSYDGVVVDASTQDKLSGVQVLVLKKGKVIESYGISIYDTIHHKEREKLILGFAIPDTIHYSEKMKLEKVLYDKDGWTQFTDSEGHLVKHIPKKSDSLGQFTTSLFEGAIFGAVEYQIKFIKEGYKDYIIEGDWITQQDMKIELDKINVR